DGRRLLDGRCGLGLRSGGPLLYRLRRSLLLLGFGGRCRRATAAPASRALARAAPLAHGAQTFAVGAAAAARLLALAEALGAAATAAARLILLAEPPGWAGVAA